MAKPDIAILNKYVMQLKLSFTVNGATDAKFQVIFDGNNPFDDANKVYTMFIHLPKFINYRMLQR